MTRVDTLRASRDWPLGNHVNPAIFPKNINRPTLQKVIEDAFSEPDAQHPRRTRAAVIVYKGKIITEKYAAHFWLPAVDEEDVDLKGMYYASGHDGQYISIVPAHDLVVVRLGLTKQGVWNQSRFVRDIISTLK